MRPAGARVAAAGRAFAPSLRCGYHNDGQVGLIVERIKQMVQSAWRQRRRACTLCIIS